MIYIIWAPPKEGKTYYATQLALKEMRSGKRRVLSNYPIICKVPLSLFSRVRNLFRKDKIKEKIISSYVWKPEYVYSGIHDSMIIIDESYRDYSSRKFKDFNVDIHTFFATNGHDMNDIYLITQHPNRIDVIIREMTNIFYHVKKIGIGKRALLFFIRGYLSEEDFIRRKSDKGATYSRKFLIASKYVKNSYDYRFFKNTKPPIDFISWVERVANVNGTPLDKVI